MIRKLIMFFLNIIRNRRYNKPHSFATWYNQWLHQGFLWNWYSYETYSEYQMKPPMDKNGVYII